MAMMEEVIGTPPIERQRVRGAKGNEWRGNKPRAARRRTTRILRAEVFEIAFVWLIWLLAFGLIVLSFVATYVVLAGGWKFDGVAMAGTLLWQGVASIAQYGGLALWRKERNQWALLGAMIGLAASVVPTGLLLDGWGARLVAELGWAGHALVWGAAVAADLLPEALLVEHEGGKQE